MRLAGDWRKVEVIGERMQEVENRISKLQRRHAQYSLLPQTPEVILAINDSAYELFREQQFTSVLMIGTQLQFAEAFRSFIKKFRSNEHRLRKGEQLRIKLEHVYMGFLPAILQTDSEYIDAIVLPIKREDIPFDGKQLRNPVHDFTLGHLFVELSKIVDLRNSGMLRDEECAWLLGIFQQALGEAQKYDREGRPAQRKARYEDSFVDELMSLLTRMLLLNKKVPRAAFPKTDAEAFDAGSGAHGVLFSFSLFLTVALADETHGYHKVVRDFAQLLDKLKYEKRSRGGPQQEIGDTYYSEKVIVDGGYRRQIIEKDIESKLYFEKNL